MELTAAVVDEKVAEYPDVQPLSSVEAEHVEMLPRAFASGDFGWRDAEWVVQWYYRRYLGAYPDSERRAAEAAYGENSLDAVRTAVAAAVEAEGVAERMAHLTTLEGVDVPVASAFLQFIDPDRHVVVGDRVWRALHDAGALEVGYPDPPTVPEYERYLGTVRSLADRHDRDLWDLYRALWVLGTD